MDNIIYFWDNCISNSVVCKTKLLCLLIYHRIWLWEQVDSEIKKDNCNFVVFKPTLRSFVPFFLSFSSRIHNSTSIYFICFSTEYGHENRVIVNLFMSTNTIFKFCRLNDNGISVYFFSFFVIFKPNLR